MSFRSASELARLRRRYLAAMGLPAAVPVVLVAACAQGSGAPLVTAPLFDGEGGAPLASAAIERDAAPETSAKVAHDPPEPTSPSPSYMESQSCTTEYATPTKPELPPPFETCPKRSGDGQFTARATRLERANQPDACCYVTFRRRMVIGRALRASDPETAARAVPRADWTAAIALPSAAALDRVARSRIARAYREDAAAEHASIAAFARVALELMALGAPADLVASAHAAAMDEVRHARHSYAIAAAYDGRIEGPAALAAPSLASAPTLASVAAEAAIDGAFGETAAAAIAREASAQATDPALVATLAAMADDEERHAELAFHTIAWAVREGGAEVARAVREAVASIAIEDESFAIDAPAHGRLGGDARRAIRSAVLANVVEPVLFSRLTARPPPPRSPRANGSARARTTARSGDREATR